MQEPAGFEGQVSFIKAPEPGAETNLSAIEATVRDVLGNVKARGDAALRDYSRSFDNVEVESIEVSKADQDKAVAGLDPQTRKDTEFAIAQVRSFAEAQRRTILPLDIETLPGVHLGHRIIPISKVGAYVPGGRYPLLSAPIMTLVPATVAGCSEIIACLPPTAHPAMIAGCVLSGAHRIFRVGGARPLQPWPTGPKVCLPFTRFLAPAMLMSTRPSGRSSVLSASTSLQDPVKSSLLQTRPATPK